MKTNRQVVLASYVADAAQPGNFAMSEGPIPEPGEGEFLLQNMYFSMEPAIRGWVDGKANYFEPILLGGVIRGPSVGQVIQSRNCDFAEGDFVLRSINGKTIPSATATPYCWRNCSQRQAYPSHTMLAPLAAQEPRLI